MNPWLISQFFGVNDKIHQRKFTPKTQREIFLYHIQYYLRRATVDLIKLIEISKAFHKGKKCKGFCHEAIKDYLQNTIALHLRMKRKEDDGFCLLRAISWAQKTIMCLPDHLANCMKKSKLASETLKELSCESEKVHYYAELYIGYKHKENEELNIPYDY